VTDARSHLAALVGQEIYTLTRRMPNLILGLDGDDVIVGTRKSPGGERVPIELVQDGIDLLEQGQEVAVDVETLGHRGAFVGAVLATLPGAVVRPTTPRRVGIARDR
jgi:hypothetical protein